MLTRSTGIHPYSHNYFTLIQQGTSSSTLLSCWPFRFIRWLLVAGRQPRQRIKAQDYHAFDQCSWLLAGTRPTPASSANIKRPSITAGQAVRVKHGLIKK